MSHVSPDRRARIRELIEQHGEQETCRRLGLLRHTLARVLAGLPVRAGTVALVAQALDTLDQGRAA